MADIHEIRRQNVQALIDKRFDGKQSAFALDAGIDATYVNRVLRLPGDQHRKNIGDVLKRKIEAKYDIDLDMPNALKGRSGAAVGVAEPQPTYGEEHAVDRATLKGVLFDAIVGKKAATLEDGDRLAEAFRKVGLESEDAFRYIMSRQGPAKSTPTPATAAAKQTPSAPVRRKATPAR